MSRQCVALERRGSAHEHVHLKYGSAAAAAAAAATRLPVMLSGGCVRPRLHIGCCWSPTIAIDIKWRGHFEASAVSRRTAKGHLHIGVFHRELEHRGPAVRLDGLRINGGLSTHQLVVHPQLVAEVLAQQPRVRPRGAPCPQREQRLAARLLAGYRFASRRVRTCVCPP